MSDYDRSTDEYLGYSHKKTPDTPVGIYESHTVLEALGNLRGKTVVDLCCGDGRFTRRLIALGARNVVGVDQSKEMIARAEKIRSTLSADEQARLRFVHADIATSDADLGVVDIVTGLYVLHYAPSTGALQGMGQFIARHLKPGGQCAVLTMNPDLDPHGILPKPVQREVSFTFTEGPQATLRLGSFSCSVYRWTRAQHAEALGAAGLTDLDWRACDVPADRPDLKTLFAEEMAHPYVAVLTATVPAASRAQAA